MHQSNYYLILCSVLPFHVVIKTFSETMAAHRFVQEINENPEKYSDILLQYKSHFSEPKKSLTVKKLKELNVFILKFSSKDFNETSRGKWLVESEGLPMFEPTIDDNTVFIEEESQTV